MVDPDKQAAHWRSGADEDWSVAVELIERGRFRHGLFFAHLALEKTLKALICRQSRELAPPIHNLVRLAEKAGLSLTDAELDLLAEVNEFNIEGRYPDLGQLLPSAAEAEGYLKRIREMLRCLNRQF